MCRCTAPHGCQATKFCIKSMAVGFDIYVETASARLMQTNRLLAGGVGAQNIFSRPLFPSVGCPYATHLWSSGESA